MRYTAREAKSNLFLTFFYVPLHIDVLILADQQQLIYLTSVCTQDIVLKTYREQWTIGMDLERNKEVSHCVMMMIKNNKGIKLVRGR